MTGLPSGTVTFLFTDIERSTENVALLGNERYAELLDVHRDLLRSAFAAHSGHEVGTEGDAFFVAFARAGDAIAAAAEGQRAMDSQKWPGEARLRVRMGLHTGEALVRQNDYVGHDVHKAKRICDAGHGGQILLSQTTADLVRDNMSVVDLGPHRLKDLGEPQRIFQVGHETFPPLRSLESFRHNLPMQRTAFIGREAEIEELRRLLEQSRLVTLTGVGGCGKTRLAQQVGAEVLDRYPDGVFFVDLAQLADPDVVPATIASAIGVPMMTDIGAGLRATTDELLFDFLSRRTCLVILDNCEHLLDACADMADRILTRCPDVTVLATSREALDVDGEQPSRVPSLSLPTDGDVQDSEAVSLFKSRARTARPDFELTPQNIDAVSEICARLDGIPLAIEFAAARTSHLSPQEIAARLGDMFKLLAGGRRRRMQRQQTLQAALDWSYELLSEAERVLLRRLGVFPASFPLEAAEGICGVDGVDERSVLDLLGSLVAKSLVNTEEREGKTRYRLIETVRLYSTEKLREAGEADALRSRHRDWYYAWVAAFGWDEVFEVVGRTAAILSAEHASLRAALEWSEAEDRLDLVIGMAARMRGVWTLGHFEEGVRWLTVARPEDVDLTPDERVAALAMTAFQMNVLQLPGAAEFTDRAVEAGRPAPGPPLAFARYVRAVNIGIASQWTRDPELADAARREIDEAVRAAQGHPYLTRIAMTGRGLIEMILGNIGAAAAAYAQVPPDRNELEVAQRATASHMTGAHDDARRYALAFLEIVHRNAQRRYLFGFIAGPATALAGAGDVAGARGLCTSSWTRPGARDVRERSRTSPSARPASPICPETTRALRDSWDGCVRARSTWAESFLLRECMRSISITSRWSAPRSSRTRHASISPRAARCPKTKPLL